MSSAPKTDKSTTSCNKALEYDGTDLKKLLDNVNPAGSFATAGNFTAPSLCPKITIEDFGTVGLPLHPMMADALKNMAEKAPFGRGPATLIDESVRRAWQINPAKVSVEGADWKVTMSKLVKKASYELGISNENVEKLQIKANLYKVLLYEVGGHFKPHKDTEKEDGMFGTLVIQLPSHFGGSASVVSHQEESKRFELDNDCDSTFKYMAFYADCDHEILPITEGWRFCLVYNLVVTKPNGSGVVPDANEMLSTVKELKIEVAKWLSTSTGKIGYPLDHYYTLDNFGFGNMKGRDAVVMSVLRNAVDETGSRLFKLALVIFFHRSYYGAYDSDEEYGVEKVLLEDGAELSDQEASPVWVDKVMHRGKDGLLRDDERSNKCEDIDDGEDIGDEHEAWKKHHDAGNEGGGETTWYRSACLVFCPAPQMGLASTIVSLCASSS